MAGLGQPKTGGRLKGTKNRATLAFIDRVQEIQAQGLDCDPIQILMELSCGRKLSDEEIDLEPSVRAKAATELCSFLFPRRKAVEVSGAERTAITFAVVADDSSIAASDGERV